MRHALLAFHILLSCAVSAQLNGKYTFRHIGISEGLLNSWVKGIAQDEFGYMWFLSEGGLQRYDGHRFVNYPELQDIYPGEIFPRLYADQKGSLIMKKGGRYVRFDLRTHRFTVHKPEDLFPSSPSVPEIDFPGQFFTGLGIEARIASDKIGHVRVSPKMTLAYEKETDNVVGSLLNYSMDMKGRSSWISRDTVTGFYLSFDCGDLVMWDSKTKQSYHSARDTALFPVFKAYNKIKVRCHRGLMMDSHRRLWIHTDEDIMHRLDFNTLETKTFSLRNPAQRTTTLSGYPWGILEDQNKMIWIITENAGLIFLDQKKDELQWITSSEKISQGLRYNFAIVDITQDRDGNIWLATDQGVNVFNPSQNYFQVIHHIEDEPASLPKNEIINTFETSKGEVMVATWGGGVAIYDLQWNLIRNIIFPEMFRVNGLNSSPTEHERMLMNMTWCFAEFDDGTLWIGAQEGFLHIFDPVQKIFTTHRPPEMRGSTIKRMVKDPYDNLYMGLGNGRIVVWNNKDKVFYPFDDTKNKFSSHMGSINHVIVDHNGTCWAASEYCLLEYDKDQHTFINFHCPGDSIRPYFFRTVMQWDDSTLIVGLRGKGALLFNTHTRQFTRPAFYPQVEHLTVGAFQKDNEGNLWMSAVGSIYRYDWKQSTMAKINLGYNALRSNFDYNPMMSMKDGRWIVSTLSEVICLDLRRIKSDDTRDKRVFISGFMLRNNDINIDSILSASEPLQLRYDQNFFTIEFTSQDYHNVYDITYSYRMRGIEQEWNANSTKHFADYTDLKPGEYVFEVKANYGSHESGITTFPIYISPPWWATWWFRAICILALTSVVYYFVRRRIETIRKEAELKHKISETEMMALRAQMNPHFIFNCLNSIDNLIQTNQKEKATEYLAKFAKLIRAILENSKNNVVPFWKDMEALQLYLELEELRWDKKIHYSIHVDPLIQNGDYKIPPLIIQPFVENAIHHGLLNKKGNDKNLTITAELEGESIKYTIMDNGVGRQLAAEYKKVNRSSHNSFGTQITQDRVDIFNKGAGQSINIVDLYDEDHVPAGTKVEVWLTTQP